MLRIGRPLVRGFFFPCGERMQREVRGTGTFVHSISQQQQCVSEVMRRLRAKPKSSKVLKKKTIFLRASLNSNSTENKKFTKQKHRKKLRKNRVLESLY